MPMRARGGALRWRESPRLSTHTHTLVHFLRAFTPCSIRILPPHSGESNCPGFNKEVLCADLAECANHCAQSKGVVSPWFFRPNSKPLVDSASAAPPPPRRLNESKNGSACYGASDSHHVAWVVPSPWACTSERSAPLEKRLNLVSGKIWMCVCVCVWSPARFPER